MESLLQIKKYNDMENNTIEIGYWNRKKEKIKLHYPDISDEDLSFYEGKEVEMIDRLGYKLGMTLEEMRKIINAL